MAQAQSCFDPVHTTPTCPALLMHKLADGPGSSPTVPATVVAEDPLPGPGDEFMCRAWAAMDGWPSGRRCLLAVIPASVPGYRTRDPGTACPARQPALERLPEQLLHLLQ